MLDVPTRDISARIDAMVRNFLKGGAPNGEIGPDRNLEELGLTSIDMVNLMLAVEAEFERHDSRLETDSREFSFH